jgi:hypothetical protein
MYNMNPSNLLRTLGDDWHNPHPYWALVQKVVPESPFLRQLEESLVEVYVNEHYDYKIYKTPVKETLYDYDILRYQHELKKLEEESKKEKDIFENLCTKLKEFDGVVLSTEHSEKEETEEEEEEIVDLPNGKKDVQINNGKSGKQSKKDLDRQRKQKEATLKTLQSSLATSQQKLIELQATMDDTNKKLLMLEGYKNAALTYTMDKKKIILEYESSQDIEKLIRQMDHLFQEYDRMKRRVAPLMPCKGEGRKICDAHYHALEPHKYTEKGVVTEYRCALYPVC